MNVVRIMMIKLDALKLFYAYSKLSLLNVFLDLWYNCANWKLVIIFRSLPHYQCKFPSIDIVRGRADFSWERINYFCAPWAYRLNLGYYFGVKKGHLAVKFDLLWRTGKFDRKWTLKGYYSIYAHRISNSFLRHFQSQNKTIWRFVKGIESKSDAQH